MFRLGLDDSQRSLLWRGAPTGLHGGLSGVSALLGSPSRSVGSTKGSFQRLSAKSTGEEIEEIRSC